jgi:3-hydroxybutyryl-CoA dehydrogenase
MQYRKIMAAGAGTMGSQVAWQMAFHGKQVTVYDPFPEGLEKCRAFHRDYAEHFLQQRGATRQQIDATFARLTYTGDLAEAVFEADLISESVPESLSIKQDFWREVSKHAPAHTVFTTNSSTMMPSQLVEYVDRPERFLALHFAIGVWDRNIGEVMGHPGTDSAVFDSLLQFAGEIGLVPTPILKEQPGYIINSLLVPWLMAALDLVVRGVSDHASVDRTWMIASEAGMGPFAMLDQVGMGVAQHIARNLGESGAFPLGLEYARYLEENFIQKGHLGAPSGKGFYSYPDPAYASPGFLLGRGLL